MLRCHIMPSLAFCVDDESKEYADIDKGVENPFVGSRYSKASPMFILRFIAYWMKPCPFSKGNFIDSQNPLVSMTAHTKHGLQFIVAHLPVRCPRHKAGSKPAPVFFPVSYERDKPFLSPDRQIASLTGCQIRRR